MKVKSILVVGALLLSAQLPAYGGCGGGLSTGCTSSSTTSGSGGGGGGTTSKPTPAPVLTSSMPAYWEGVSYYAQSSYLKPINASSAYAQGFSGKGSTIGVVDTGIATSALGLFGNRITAVKDFTGSGTMNDVVGHGTAVTGIAAAGLGPTIQGVAYDANLLIAKISNTGSGISDASMINGVAWASANGANVVNLSMNFTLPSTTKLTQINPGVFTTSNTNTGILPLGINPTNWANALGRNTVLVIGAGNDGALTPGALGSLATATNSSGQLILNGQVIIAGNWNQFGNAVNSTSNLAGSMCAVTSNGVCQDKYSVSQFYLLAPGTAVNSATPAAINSNGYQNYTGTSMSAAVISGAAAIIHQQWPQMTASNIAQLLLQTANKNIPNYNPNTMGQGLLDLNKATQPVGPVGIPTTGASILSATSSAPSTMLVSSGNVGTGKIASVMVVDSFHRDYYVPGKAFTAVAPSPAFNINQASMPYISKNNYSQFNNFTDYKNASAGDIEMGVYLDKNYNAAGNLNPSMFELGYNKFYGTTKVKFTAGGLIENGTWLGNSTPTTGLGNSTVQSYTTFTGVQLDQKVTNTTNVYANVTHGITNTNGINSAMMTGNSPILSYSWSLGVDQKINDNNTVGIMTYQPVTVYRAMVNSNVPVGLDSNFNVVSAGNINLAADVKEYRAGLYHRFTNKDASTSVMTFIENRQNYRGQPGVTDNVVGMTASVRF